MKKRASSREAVASSRGAGTSRDTARQNYRRASMREETIEQTPLWPPPHPPPRNPQITSLTSSDLKSNPCLRGIQRGGLGGGGEVIPTRDADG